MSICMAAIARRWICAQPGVCDHGATIQGGGGLKAHCSERDRDPEKERTTPEANESKGKAAARDRKADRRRAGRHVQGGGGRWGGGAMERVACKLPEAKQYSPLFWISIELRKEQGGRRTL